MIKRFNRLSIFYKYLISYLFIFILPLIIMTVFLYKNNVVNLQKDIESSNLSKLIQVKEFTDMRIKELELTSIKIGLDNRLIPYMMRNDSSKAEEGINELGRYKANNMFVEDILLYFRGDEIIYSPQGVSSLNTLTDYTYRLTKEKKESFIEQIKTIKLPVIKPSEKVDVYQTGVKEFITYMHPVANNLPEPFATAIFFIRKETFGKMIKDILGEFEGATYILDPNRNILVSENSGSSIKLHSINELTSYFQRNGVQNIKLSGENYSIVNTKSDSTGWIFVTIMPTNQFFKKAIYMKTLILLIVLVLMVLGVGVAVTLSIHNYKPIKKLEAIIKMQLPQSTKKREKNEIDEITDTMAYALNENKYLSEQITSQRPMIKDQIMLMLLHGRVTRKADIKTQLDNLNINLSGPLYNVMIISGFENNKAGESTTYKDAVLDIVKQTLSESGTAYAVEIVHENVIALIVNLSGSEEQNEQQSVVSMNLYNTLKDNINIPLFVGIGKSYNDIMYINRSFIEASAAIEYGEMKRDNNIIFFTDITSFQKQYWYPAEEQMRFLQSFKQGDRSVALENLERMLLNIKAKNISPAVLKCVSFDVINTVIKALHEINIELSSEELEELIDFTSLEKLEYRLQIVLNKVCEFIDASRKNKSNELINNILEYINGNYMDCNISLDAIAQKFDLSLYYLSRFFKEQAGCNFIDYVTELRIKEAKRLLTTTKEPIKDIVNSVGYLDVASFARKFKRLEGLTPGQYRELHAN
jgi:two-component system, response regulator YesN